MHHGNPANCSLVEARFTLRLATDPVTFTDQPPYLAALSGHSLPSIQTEQADPLLGVNVFPSGSVEAVNADGLFDYPAVAYNWANRTATFKLGGGSLAYSDYETVALMQLTQPPGVKSGVAIFQFRSLSNATDTAFPIHTYGDDVEPIASYILQPAGAAIPSSRYLPILWGSVTNVPLQRLDIVGKTTAVFTRCQACDPLVLDTWPRTIISPCSAAA